MFPTLHGIRYTCVISLRNFSALLRSHSSPSSCVEPLLYSSCAWSRSTRPLAGLWSVAAAVAENSSTAHCTVSREYFVRSGNSCLCCCALHCPGSAAGGQPALWEWSWGCLPSLLFLRWDAWKMPSAGTTATPATAAGSRGSTSVPRCLISSFRNPS